MSDIGHDALILNLSRLRHFWQSVCEVALEDAVADGPRMRLIIETYLPVQHFQSRCSTPLSLDESESQAK